MRLSAGWALTGALLFALAIVAPLLVFWLTDGLQHRQLEMILAEAPAEEERPGDRDLAQPFVEPDRQLADAVIGPGQGIGDLKLGLPVTEIRPRLPAETVSWFEPGSTGVHQFHRFGIGDAALTVESRADDGLVMAVKLALASCALDGPGQAPQEKLPRMLDGLSVGSHISRVILRLGAPEYGTAPPALSPSATEPVEISYPGMTLSYCPKSMRVRAITVHPVAPPDAIAARMSTDLPLAMASADRVMRAPQPVLSAPDEMRPPHRGLVPGRPAGRAQVTAPDADLSPQSAHLPGGPPVNRDAPGRPDATMVDATLLGQERPSAFGRPSRQQFVASIRPVTLLPDNLAARVANLTLPTAVAQSGAATNGALQHDPVAGQVLADGTGARDETRDEIGSQPGRPTTPHDLDRVAQEPGASSDASRLALAPVTLKDDDATAVEPHGSVPPSSEPADRALSGQSRDSLAALQPAGDSPPAPPLAAGLRDVAQLPPRTEPGLAAAAPSDDRSGVSYQLPDSVTAPVRVVDPVPASIQDAPAPSLPMSILVAAADAAESELALSLHQRRDVQRQLRALGYNPRGIDGVFGPRTRDAIAAFQADEGLPATGFVDPRLLARIGERGGIALAALQRTHRAAKRSEPPALIVARVPEGRNAPECSRDGDGRIVANQSFDCDVSQLGESLRSLFASND